MTLLELYSAPVEGESFAGSVQTSVLRGVNNCFLFAFEVVSSLINL